MNEQQRPDDVDPQTWKFSTRFHKVSNGYARRVHDAYDGDIEQALADDDLTAAATVSTWEASNGLMPRDWHGIGLDDEGRAEDRELDRALAEGRAEIIDIGGT